MSLEEQARPIWDAWVWLKRVWLTSDEGIPQTLPLFPLQAAFMSLGFYPIIGTTWREARSPADAGGNVECQWAGFCEPGLTCLWTVPLLLPNHLERHSQLECEGRKRWPRTRKAQSTFWVPSPTELGRGFWNDCPKNKHQENEMVKGKRQFGWHHAKSSAKHAVCPITAPDPQVSLVHHTRTSFLVCLDLRIFI